MVCCPISREGPEKEKEERGKKRGGQLDFGDQVLSVNVDFGWGKDGRRKNERE